MENLGPKSGHWKRLTRAARADNSDKENGSMLKKRVNSTPLQELEPNTLDQKKKETPRPKQTTQIKHFNEWW